MRLESLGSNQTLVTIGNDKFYFSYNTCVAISNKEGNFRIKSPSVTTTQHMNEIGVSNFLLISNEEFAKYLPKTRLPPLTK